MSHPINPKSHYQVSKAIGRFLASEEIKPGEYTLTQLYKRAVKAKVADPWDFTIATISRQMAASAQWAFNGKRGLGSRWVKSEPKIEVPILPIPELMTDTGPECGGHPQWAKDMDAHMTEMERQMAEMDSTFRNRFLDVKCKLDLLLTNLGISEAAKKAEPPCPAVLLAKRKRGRPRKSC